MSWKNNFIFCIFILLGGFSFITYAAPAEKTIIVARHCLIKRMTHPYSTLIENQNLSLIATDIRGIQQLINLKQHQKKVCGGFIDVTEEWHQFTIKPVSESKKKLFLKQYDMPIHTSSETAHYSIKYEPQVNQLLHQINPQNMWNNLTTLTNFQDRFAFSENGVDAAKWIKNQVETIAKQTNHDNDVTVYFIDTGRFRQPSVVAKFGNEDGPGIVIGGHIDSIVKDFFGRSPGADDDGSGTVTVMEVARTLLTSGMRFKKPIYFIWYAAEEMGLVGSKVVVSEFQKKRIPIEAIIQLDLTGYAPKNDSTIWLINDFVNVDLTTYLKLLIHTYVKQPSKDTQCGYACSDHASWYKAGFAASMPVEAAFGKEDPYIHTEHDTMDILSLNHMTDFVKLGIAFAVELAEPTNA
ncbi:MAG: hypothetical protein A3F42_05735 [Gammaproteobacteria bacterium RIFCSPHIGHO2_12_FULL_37_34]|nr:MAG: hypothetical protein A3F42_05735 [Gammaproteobacteria bacterium RIFCSPHIGHO2_12_FULL_37_34]